VSSREETHHCRPDARAFAGPISRAIYATAVLNSEPLKNLDVCLWGTCLVSGSTGAMAHILRDAIEPSRPPMTDDEQRAMIREIHRELMDAVQAIVAKRAGNGFSMLVVDAPPDA
jgi:hypothetical protein